MLWLILATVALLAQAQTPGPSLPRCPDSVCARDPHCIYVRGLATCWDVANTTSGACKCCQNCINNEQFLSEECARQLLACVPRRCPQVRCAYGSYTPDCDCCSKCLPKECDGVGDSERPNCAVVFCRACPDGTEAFTCPNTCCPVCLQR
ncbi:uncharacterized protein LOC144155109 isoform X1 [Haemaphysalis longicornis]